MTTISFTGNYGALIVDAHTGNVLVYHPEPGESPEYADVRRVDLDERRAWYATQGVTLPDIQPDGDVLDVCFITEMGERVEAEEDYRREIVLAVYGSE